MPVLEGPAVTPWALCGFPQVLLPVLNAGKFTLGQCEGEGKSKSLDSPCQITLAAFPGSLWGAAFPHTPSNPSPWVESSQCTGGKGTRGCVCEPRLPSPWPGVPLGCCSPEVTPLQSFVQLQRGPSSFICLWRRDHPGRWPWHDLFSPECNLQSSRVGSSSDTNVFFSTKKEIFKWKPRELQIFPST